MKKRIINLFICLCIFFIGVILVSCDLTKTTATHIMIVGDGITYDGYQSTSAQPLALINGENSSFYYQISALDDNGGQSVIQDIKHEVKNVTSNLQIISEKGTNNLTLKFNSGENILNINTTISLRLYSRSNSALSINVEISCYFYDAKSIVDETIIDQQTNNSYISTSTSSQDTINYLGHAVDYNNQALPITWKYYSTNNELIPNWINFKTTAILNDNQFANTQLTVNWSTILDNQNIQLVIYGQWSKDNVVFTTKKHYLNLYISPTVGYIDSVNAFSLAIYDDIYKLNLKTQFNQDYSAINTYKWYCQDLTNNKDITSKVFWLDGGTNTTGINNMRFSANFFKSFATYPAYDTNEIMIRVVGTSTINPQMHEEITKTIRIKLYEHPIGSINIHGPSEIKITSNYINLDQYFQNSIIGDEQYLNAGLKWIVMSTSKINARSIIINSISHSQLQNLFVHNSGYEKTKYNFEIRPIDELSNSYLKIKHTITFIV